MIKELPIPGSPIIIIKFSNENPRIASHILTVKYKWELEHSTNKVSSEKKERGIGHISKQILLFFFKKTEVIDQDRFPNVFSNIPVYETLI